MDISVTHTGEFDLQLYSYQTGIPLDTLETALSTLTGPVGLWHVIVHDPDDHDPHGRLVLEHQSFNQHTQVIIASRTVNQSLSYDVHRPMETDILTEADGVSIETAVETAVETANREVRRQSRLAPAFAVTDRVRNALVR